MFGKVACLSCATFVLGFVLYFSCTLVFAQALPVSRMQSAVSGVTQQKMSQRGFAANDPRYGGTMTSISSYVGGVAGAGAVAVTVGVITAPAWVSFAVSAAVGGLVTYAVTMAVDGLLDWFFRPDGKIDQSGKVNLNYGWAGFELGDTVWRYRDFNGDEHQGGAPEGLAQEFRTNDLIRQGVKEPSVATCFSGSPKVFYCGNYGVTLDSIAQVSCGRGMQAVNNVCTPYTYKQPPVVPTKQGQTIQQAIDAMPNGELQKQLNPVIVAAVADTAWKNAAAQPGYNGLPYLANDPITPADVRTWKDANPERYPTVGDFTAPQSAANNPWTLPSSPTSPTQNPGPAPSAGTNPAASQPLQNLGTDPGIGAPSLEPTPTPQMILAPILELFPALKSFTVPSHSSQCPVANFSAFGKQFVVDSHCTMSESIRATLATVMAAVWAMVALFIVLRA